MTSVSLPYDSAVPHLAQALDASQMGRVFLRAQVDSDRLQLETCVIERSKYKPGKNCLVCYRVVLRDVASNTSHEQRW